ncbi:MAG: DUF5615 family PIN-like protein [Chloroflexi bacterium]|nr:DUF5615 family PIN-like protein [Chloroflexota bacterium]
MSILLDNCVPQKYVRLLRSWGYTVTMVKQHIAPDAPDPNVLALAQELDAVLVTEDMDFSSVVNYPPQNYGGIIVLRYDPLAEATIIPTLQQALKDLYRDEMRGAMVIVKPNRYRIRRLPKQADS